LGKQNIFILRLDTECDTFDLLSNSPEFEATDQHGIRVVASYSCHRDMNELPTLQSGDAPICYALAKHSNIVSFLMSKSQSPEDVKASGASQPEDMEAEDSYSDSDPGAKQPDLAPNSYVHSDSDDFDTKGRSAHLSHQLNERGSEQCDASIVHGQEGLPRKRKRLVSNDSDSEM